MNDLAWDIELERDGNWWNWTVLARRDDKCVALERNFIRRRSRYAALRAAHRMRDKMIRRGFESEVIHL